MCWVSRGQCEEFSIDNGHAPDAAELLRWYADSCRIDGCAQQRRSPAVFALAKLFEVEINGRFAYNAKLRDLTIGIGSG